MGEDEAHKLWETTIRHDGRIDALENNWAELRIFMDAVTKELGRLSSYNVEVASGLRKAVFGNGQPGLQTEMVETKTTIKEIKNLIEDRKQVHDKELGRVHAVLCWGGISLFGVLVGTIGWLIPYLIKYVGGH